MPAIPDAVIDMKEAKTVSAFSVDKRPWFQEEAYGLNGSMGKFELYKSDDGENWTKFDEGEFTADDYNLHKVDSLFNVGDRVAFNFTAPQTARYFKVRGFPPYGIPTSRNLQLPKLISSKTKFRRK